MKQSLEEFASEGPYAFPFVLGDLNAACAGMTLRDYFAAKVLVGALPTELLAAQTEETLMAFMDGIAQVCYGVADAMLKARQA